MFEPDVAYDGAWIDLATGVNPEWANIEEANGANDGPGIPVSEPIYTRLEGPWGLPYWDGEEDPYRLFDAPFTANPQPWSPNEDVGALPRVTAYEGAYRTRGSVYQWGHEMSGGLHGDQALGRIMRFPANIPDRFDPYGVFNTDVRDDLAAGMAVDNMDIPSGETMTTDLLQWPNIWGRW